MSALSAIAQTAIGVYPSREAEADFQAGPGSHATAAFMQSMPELRIVWDEMECDLLNGIWT